MLKKTNAWLWIPTLYFASGLPYHAITSISDIMYKDMGVANGTIALLTSIFLIPWTIKPLWSPLVELISTRRKWTLYSQLLLVLCFAAIAFAAPSDSFLLLTSIAFIAGAFVSSTHDIALDGFYILGLSQKEQSFFSGIRNTFYRIATVFGSGILVMLAASLGKHYGNDALGWSATFATTAVIMLTLFLYNRKAMPKPDNDIDRTPRSINDVFRDFGDIIRTYFNKPGIWAALLFLLLFRFPEAQLGKIGKLFLMDPTAAGGLGLEKGDIGFLNGVIGIIGLIIGGIAGGICISRKGLKYWLWPMVIAISLPDAVYVYMSMAMPDNLYIIGSCIFVEQLGYGFGFTAYTLYMIYFAQGKYPTAHFAISTAFMSLGMMLPGMISGYIQEWLGYENFFIWVMICTSVTFIVSTLIKIDPSFGKK
jgi:PAT family beta-lactamase induction signal transducer AmpG